MTANEWQHAWYFRDRWKVTRKRSTTEVLFWDGWLSMNYHSLQVALNRRFTRGLFVKGAYTFSRAINMTDDEGWAGVGWNDPALIGRNRSQAGFNIPHIFQLGMVYELPFGKGGGLGNHLVRGWQVNAVISAHSNQPFTVGSASVMNARGNIQTADQVKPEVKKLGGKGVRTGNHRSNPPKARRYLGRARRRA